MRPVTLAPKGGLPRLTKPYRVAVVGGGLAGVASAVILAERGASVTVYDRETTLGGRVRGWPITLTTGDTVTMERGFHAFFRQYYNLRALLERVNPGLTWLTPLEDYPLLGPDGLSESFAGLPRQTPLNLMALVARTKTMRLVDLPKIPPWPTFEMLAYDAIGTFERLDGVSARAFLDALNFPTAARQMLFDVFAHSFFNPEREMSAAEMIRLFHIYFTGNPEGLVFDVLNRPFTAVWDAFRGWLEARGAAFALGTTVRAISGASGRFEVRADGPTGGRIDHFDAVVVAAEVPGLKAIAAGSTGEAGEALATAARSVHATAPFVVWRRWLDRPVLTQRAPFAATGGLGRLDNLSILNHFQDEAQVWANATGGSVVELHAYALDDTDVATLKEELWRTAITLYPELTTARVLDERVILAADCPAFRRGDDAVRPSVTTALPGLVLAGDHIKLPVPAALMEGAVTSGILAANALLEREHVRGEPIRSVPLTGVLRRVAAGRPRVQLPERSAA